MSLRVRCTGCTKKISVDDAFAGGTCRCPYCKEIVLVGRVATATGGPRPMSPVDRPDAPDQSLPSQPEDVAVPMAKPIRLQGALTIVLMALVVVMIGIAAWVGIALHAFTASDSNSNPPNPLPGMRPARGDGAGSPGQAPGQGSAINPPGTPAGQSSVSPTNAPPAQPAGPNVAGISIDAPVIYVVDCGGSTKNVFDYARYMVRLSITSLGPSRMFSLILSTEGGEQLLPSPGKAGDLRPADAGAEAAAKELLGITPSDDCDIEKAVASAIARRPKTIVLICRKPIDGASAKTLADKAKAAGIVIDVIGLAADKPAADSFAILSGVTAGRTKVFDTQALADWADHAPPLE